MKPSAFNYRRPTTVDEAVHLLEADPDAKVIAGGQSLVPLLNFRLATPSTIVDLAGIDALDHIEVKGQQLCIGARVTQRAAAASDVVRQHFSLLPACIAHIGHQQIRSRGTVCGSIAHGDPSSELPAAAVACGSEMVVVGSSGTRTIPAADFFLAPLWTALAGDEILTEVRFPVDQPDTRVAVREYARRSGDFAIAGVVVHASFDDTLVDPSIVAFGVGSVPVRLAAVEEVVNAGGDRAQLTDAVAADVPEPTSDGQADGTYRRELLTSLLVDALDDCRRAR